MIYETDLECLCDRFFATVAIEYEVEPAELGDRVSPGHAEVIDLHAVTVTSLSGVTWERSQEELEAGDWASFINAAAYEEVERLIGYGAWLYDQLVSFAEVPDD
ncbi:MAG: hypothetical protein ACYS7Y_27410 [Planctomycetota bacterium]|jgi:hypothetical protein